MGRLSVQVGSMGCELVLYLTITHGASAAPCLPFGLMFPAIWHTVTCDPRNRRSPGWPRRAGERARHRHRMGRSDPVGDALRLGGLVQGGARAHECGARSSPG